jgi:hypothetical protein
MRGKVIVLNRWKPLDPRFFADSSREGSIPAREAEQLRKIRG